MDKLFVDHDHSIGALQVLSQRFRQRRFDSSIFRDRDVGGDGVYLLDSVGYELVQDLVKHLVMVVFR